ncbi:MAG: penicillin-binding protein 2 [Ilumatobacteraceae bacterium]
MNKQIRRLAVGLLLCYLVLFIQLNFIQVRRAESLNADVRNQRQTERDFSKPRGPIVTADGVVIAQSMPSAPGDKFKFQRTYPEADFFSNITGYYTFSFGATELERSQDDVLMGTTTEQQVRALPNILGSNDNTGSVQLVMRDDVQRVAKVALGGRQGSVVVMDPKSGAVLAMVSNPSFDANKVAVHSFSEANAYLEELNATPGKPLLNNAYQERFMPGSSFKILTTSIGLENGVLTMDSEFPDESSWLPPQTTDPITNFENEVCGGDMATVFARSCNIPFAQTAIALGAQRMVDGVNKWGVGEKLPIDLPAPVASSFGDVDDFEDNLPLLGIGGFGQGNDQMVPLHMAMVASTVANGGQMMKPYVVDKTLDHDGGVLSTTQPSVWKNPILPATAADLTTLMIGVVERGTGRQMQLANGVSAAAKTGTAQLNAAGQPEKSNAWIVGFAPAENPKYAIAVMLRGGENDEISAGTGGRLAGPIAKSVLDYMFANDVPTPSNP